MIDKIEQVDPTLTEDGRTVLYIGHTADDDVTLVASIALPQPITEAEFELAFD